MLLRLQARWGAFQRLRRKAGMGHALRYAIRYMLSSARGVSTAIVPKRDLTGFYSFVVPKPFGDPAAIVNVPGNTVNWVIPDFGVGSGGHLNIFRLILYLERHGFECRVVIDGPCQFQDGEAARASIRKHFFPIQAEVTLGRESLRPAWATVATAWQTAYAVRDFQATRRRFYFVQDFEPYFYAHGSEYVFAEQTYRFGFHAIAAGQWLADKLAGEYGLETFAYGFSYDHHLYEPKPRKRTETRHIFFYARPVTPRRAFELGLLVFEEVARRLEDVVVVFAGWDISEYEINFPCINRGVVPLEELTDLYSDCDVALVLSFTNLSLLPLELMASGCPVVSNRGENVEWILNDDNAVLAEPTPEALAEAVVGLLEDEPRRRSLRKRALEFVRGTSWEREAERVANHFEELNRAN